MKVGEAEQRDVDDKTDSSYQGEHDHSHHPHPARQHRQNVFREVLINSTLSGITQL